MLLETKFFKFWKAIIFKDYTWSALCSCWLMKKSIKNYRVREFYWNIFLKTWQEKIYSIISNWWKAIIFKEQVEICKAMEYLTITTRQNLLLRFVLILRTLVIWRLWALFYRASLPKEKVQWRRKKNVINPKKKTEEEKKIYNKWQCLRKFSFVCYL